VARASDEVMPARTARVMPAGYSTYRQCLPNFGGDFQILEFPLRYGVTAAKNSWAYRPLARCRPAADVVSKLETQENRQTGIRATHPESGRREQLFA
jgi:hypothetical protein